MAALSLSLILPDICGGLETPGEGSKARYVRWFTRWVQPRYTRKVGPAAQCHVFLSGEDCYALRCALMHSGTADISLQPARKALEDFEFVVPPPGFTIHCNQRDETLQLQVDIFCQDMSDAVDAWDEATATDAAIEAEKRTLIRIDDWSGRDQRVG